MKIGIEDLKDSSLIKRRLQILRTRWQIKTCKDNIIDLGITEQLYSKIDFHFWYPLEKREKVIVNNIFTSLNSIMWDLISWHE